MFSLHSPTQVSYKDEGQQNFSLEEQAVEEDSTEVVLNEGEGGDTQVDVVILETGHSGRNKHGLAATTKF